MCVISGIGKISTPQLVLLCKLLNEIVDAYDTLLRVTQKDWGFDLGKMVTNQQLLREVEVEIAIRNQ